MRGPAFFVSVSALTVAAFLAGCSSSLVTTGANDSAFGAAPTVTAVAEQVNGVAPNRKQEVQFSEAMDASTINARTFIVTGSSGNAVSGMVTYDTAYDIASFQPNRPMQTDATYKLTITTGVASAEGVHPAAPYSYTFTTRATTDTSPISINSVSPAASATCVSATTPITITFDEEPDASTVNSTNIVVTGPGGTLIPVTMSINITTTQVVLAPTTALPSGTITVTVQNVGDLAGVMMTAPYIWSFSTACSTGGGGPGSGITTQYMSPLLDTETGLSGLFGQITMDTSGNTVVHLSGAATGTTYTIQFCPAFDSNSSIQAPSCFNVSTVSTDSSGNATSSVKFPQPGNWAGDFYVNDSTGKRIYQTYLLPTMANETYMATLLPDTKTNGGVVTTYSPQEPLISGTVTFTNGKLQFTVKGASPNADYSTSSSETIYMDSSGSYELSTFTTDASGNGSSSFTWGNASPGGDLFQVELNALTPSGAGYTGGFSVPE